MEDLAKIGISAPFRRSHRRERRPFTEHDDKQILDGLEKYGPAWTKIQRDSSYSLSSRQPTDLRDRVRNKYPEIYASIEKGSFQLKEQEPGRGGSTLEPSISNPSIVNSFNPGVPGQMLELNRSSSREDMGKWAPNPVHFESTDSLPLPGLAEVLVERNEAAAAPFATSAPDMDISRLLLDDPLNPRDQLSMRAGTTLAGGAGPGPGPSDASFSAPPLTHGSSHHHHYHHHPPPPPLDPRYHPTR